MNAKIRYWEYVILSDKEVEPQNPDEETAYEIAEFFLRQNGEIARRAA